jgi:hypothetical protein
MNSLKIKNKKLGLSSVGYNDFANIRNLTIQDAGEPAESIGVVNFINGEYTIEQKSVSGRPSFKKEINLGGAVYKTTLNWDKNFECWILSFHGGPRFQHPSDATSVIEVNGFILQPGDVIDVPPYQYISFSDVRTPDLATNWTRSFIYGKLSTPKLTINNQFSNLEELNIPDYNGVFDLKSVNGKPDWHKSNEYQCPPFITSIEQINESEIALNFVRLGEGCADPTALTVFSSENQINWGTGNTAGWNSPRILTKPINKTYYKVLFNFNSELGQFSNIVAFDPNESALPEPRPSKSCTPFITSVLRSGNNSISVTFTTLSNECHTPVLAFFETSTDLINWNSFSAPSISPSTFTLPSVNTYIRMKLVYTPYQPSEYSNIVMYDVNSPIPPGVVVCCKPQITNITPQFGDPNILVLEFTTGNGDCLPVTTTFLEPSTDGGITWNAGGNGPATSPWTILKPSQTTSYRIRSTCGINGNSQWSDIYTYTLN